MPTDYIARIISNMNSNKKSLGAIEAPVSQGWLAANKAPKWLIRVSQARACTGLGVG
jgi:hypothetical protein